MPHFLVTKVQAAVIAPPDIGVTFTDPSRITKNVILILVALVGVASFIMLLVGGLKYIMSGGDKAAKTSARQTVTYALIGVGLAAASYAVSSLLQSVLGINILRVSI